MLAALAERTARNATLDEGHRITRGDGSRVPSFTSIPELTSGFDRCTRRNFPDAREKFTDWESHHAEEPFGEVAIAASYLFEEFYRQGVLTSDFFLNEKKFLNGIDGKPDPELMSNFQGALARTRTLANKRLKENPKDPGSAFRADAGGGHGVRRRHDTAQGTAGCVEAA